MNSDILKNAPEGATHYRINAPIISYYKLENSVAYWYDRPNRCWIPSAYGEDKQYIAKLIPLAPLDWHNNKELPPVGTECEYIGSTTPGIYPFSRWERGDRLEVLSHRYVHGKVLPIVFNIRDMTATAVVLGVIGPIKSEREKAIEEMSKHLSFDVSKEYYVEQILGWIYDAGLRFTKQEEKTDEQTINENC